MQVHGLHLGLLSMDKLYSEALFLNRPKALER